MTAAPQSVTTPTILVTIYIERVNPRLNRFFRSGGTTPNPTGCAARERVKAEWTSGPHAGRSTEGHTSRDEAIGSLIRETAATCESSDAVIDLVASLFCDTSFRTPNAALARAVKFARHKGRRHPGALIEYRDTVERTRTPGRAKGGAA